MKWKSVKAVLSALEVLYSTKYSESQVLGIQNGAPKIRLSVQQNENILWKYTFAKPFEITAINIMVKSMTESTLLWKLIWMLQL